MPRLPSMQSSINGRNVLPPIAEKIPGSAANLATKVQIPRKLYKVVKKIFDDHDQDKDGYITQEEFVAAVCRADEKTAEEHGERARQRYFDQTVGETMAAKVEKSHMDGDKARRVHACSMFQACTCKRQEAQISLLDFVAMYFPHLSRSAVKHAIDKHTKKAPAPPKKKTLDDVDGAKEEILAMFQGLDSDRDGLVRMRSLRPKLQELGISEADLDEWVAELPPALVRAQGELKEGSSLQRNKSKLNLEDMQCLLTPVFMPATPSQENLHKIKQQIELNADLALDVIYAV